MHCEAIAVNYIVYVHHAKKDEYHYVGPFITFYLADQWKKKHRGSTIMPLLSQFTPEAVAIE